ncbi:phosphate butyryltransferase [Marinifilum breve]|uniref:Phosphate butyryltransferase n=2 Tax=Marinifilum TaxID=866673 RepID=A0A419X2Y4_9BACT|nr:MULTISPECIES: bifunctional enoyl-CoA hydratase/phosphate acetyltransferase [Marinifilum]MCY1635728.1 bifunctional enoyl-CoA hydratase/phosphate acetyltransferase [Marinifilum sp. D737]MDQ2180503.1 bifunctional enoyl-CoA hydratase/phosphate acetyltransferase [Marinifilum sp. D714]PXY02446.1 phosphate butyryltransferase [Marinifilum breve]RKE01979.1 phosphate butyryltransferase [Marinifilum flexuosum]
MITRLEQIIDVLKSNEKKRLVAAYANDAHTIEAVNNAVEKGIVDATLVGDEETIKKTCAEHNIDVTKFTVVHEPVEIKAAQKAVELIRNGEGDMIMKGLVSTDKYMKAILNKETGLMPPKAVLSHVTVMENPNYHKLLVCSDVAVIPQPDLNQKVALTNYVINVARALGIDTPKVALVAASEQVLPKMEACVDATIISKMADRGQIKNAYVDGPLAIDVAIDKESVEIKKLESKVAGDADCLVFPNIESGNVFYKTNTKLAKAELGAFVVGAKCPAILSSRGDSVLTKLYSIALAALVASK